MSDVTGIPEPAPEALKVNMLRVYAVFGWRFSAVKFVAEVLSWKIPLRYMPTWLKFAEGFVQFQTILVLVRVRAWRFATPFGMPRELLPVLLVLLVLLLPDPESVLVVLVMPVVLMMLALSTVKSVRAYEVFGNKPSAVYDVADVFPTNRLLRKS